jgi:hypothetical protein
MQPTGGRHAAPEESAEPWPNQPAPVGMESTRSGPIRPVRHRQPPVTPVVKNKTLDRKRRNALIRRLVAIVALIACLGVGVAIIGTSWSALISWFTSGPSAAPTAQNPQDTRPPPPPEDIRPIQLRVVQEMRPPDQCPPEGPVPAVPPGDVMTTCDFARSAAFILGPEALQVTLTHVETRKSPDSEFYAVRITMSQQSGAQFAAWTAQNVGAQVAFVCDGIVVFAPKITQIINSAGLEISGNLTEQQAADIERLLRKPA